MAKKTDLRLNNAQQVRRNLARIINELHNDEIAESKARTIVYATQTLLKAIELESIANARLDIDKEKLQMGKERLEMEKRINDPTSIEFEDDGFIEAMGSDNEDFSDIVDCSILEEESEEE